LPLGFPKKECRMNLERKRLAELTTLFFDCRQNRRVQDCEECGKYRNSFRDCPYKAEHDEYWELLDGHIDIFKEGRAAIAELLPERVRKCL